MQYMQLLDLSIATNPWQYHLSYYDFAMQGVMAQQ
jgi:hypothetical protein